MFYFRLAEDSNAKIFSGMCFSAGLVVFSMFGVYTAPTKEFAYNFSYLNTFWAFIGMGYIYIITGLGVKTRLFSRKNYRIFAGILCVGIITFELLFKKSIHKVLSRGDVFTIEILDHGWNKTLAFFFTVLIIMNIYELALMIKSAELTSHKRNLVRFLFLITLSMLFLGVPLFYPGLINIPLELKLPSFYLITIFLFGGIMFYFSLLEPSSRLVRESLLKNTSNFLFITDIQNVIKETNYKVEELLDPISQPLIGQKINSVIPGLDTILDRPNFKNTEKFYSDEFRLRKSDGKLLEVELFISPISNTLQETGYVIMGNDLTKMVQTQNVLRQYNEDLEKKNDDLNSFASIVSHDLRSPLNTISGFTTLIERENKDSLKTSSYEYIDFIKSSCLNMASIIEKLLSIAQNSAESINLEHIHLKDLLEDVLLHLKMKIESEKATISLGNLDMINVDRIQFIRLIQNLIENSLKYRSPDRLAEVNIHSKHEAGRINIYVSDNGIGIDEKNINSVFSKFKQIEYKSEGIGLGLATCAQIAQNHDGQIKVKSEKGKGSTFIISIPAAVVI